MFSLKLFKNMNITEPKQITVERVYAFRSDTSPVAANRVQLNCPDVILHEFRNLLKDTAILGCTFENPYTSKTETIPKHVNQLTSQHLQMLARNECVNVDGKMNVKLYQNLLTADQVARLRCLVKATNVAGVVYATHMGGSHGRSRVKFPKPEKLIVIDQAGMQWQDDFRNTGGLVFYPTNPNHSALPEGYGTWQTQMYQAMYGMERPLLPSDNTLDVFWSPIRGKLDLDLVSHALAVEFSQALDAVVHQGNVELAEDDVINFKFLRAGMGFFSSGLEGDMHQLRVARLHGIELALQRIADLPETERDAALGKIKRISLNSSKDKHYTDEVLDRIKTLVESLGLVWGGAPDEDAFLPKEGYVNAVTNCGDPHAMPGNEGGHSSTDATISTNANLNYHNAAFNKSMQLRSSPAIVLHGCPMKITPSFRA